MIIKVGFEESKLFACKFKIELLFVGKIQQNTPAGTKKVLMVPTQYCNFNAKYVLFLDLI